MNKSIIYKATEDKDIQEDLRKLKALQQEPCEDCISREHLLEEIASLKESPWFKDDTNCAMAIRKEAIEIVEDLCIRKEPSVNPQEPKTGHWKEHRNRATGHIETVCSECGAEEGYPYNDYCGNCGAKMFGPYKESGE